MSGVPFTPQLTPQKMLEMGVFGGWYFGDYPGGVDNFQIKRWKVFGARDIPKIKKNCQPADVFCRPRQRQAILQWAYEPLI